MKSKHKHIFDWWVLNARKSNARKVLRCVLCRKDLNDFLDEMKIKIVKKEEK